MRAAGDPIALAPASQHKVVMPNLSVGDRALTPLMNYLSAQAQAHWATGRKSGALRNAPPFGGRPLGQ
jgi:hypothetical protein